MTNENDNNGPILLTHVLLSECGLGGLSVSATIEPVGVDDQITHTLEVPAPMIHFYAAGSLVSTSIAERLSDAGFGDVVVELEHPVVPVALEGDEYLEDHDGEPGEETFGVAAYSWPRVMPLDDELDD